MKYKILGFTDTTLKDGGGEFDGRLAEINLNLSEELGDNGVSPIPTYLVAHESPPNMGKNWSGECYGMGRESRKNGVVLCTSDQEARYTLSKLLQRGTVAEYESEFLILIKRVTGISESLLTSFYISRLKPLLQCALLRYFSFGIHLDGLHVTWAHLEKKQTRLRTNTKTLEDLCSQRLEMASQAIHDAVITHPIMKSSTTNVETSINEEVFHEVSESFQGESSSSSLNDDVQQSSKEVILPKTNTQSISNNMIPNVDEASTLHNVFNKRLEDAYFDASTSFHDSFNVHTYYQPYPHEKKWTKDHPLHKIIGDP
nr:hypothetical protein [Tanacetum cinerariifolium]